MHANEQAIDWLIRQRDPAFADWNAFTGWLEADRRNADAYASMAVLEEDVAARLAPTPRYEVAPPSRQPPRTFGRRGALGAIAMAASIAIAIGTFQLRPQQSLHRIATKPGVQQMVTLAGGTTIALNGATEVRLDRSDSRFAELVSGEAHFAVAHDASRPFRVTVAGAELVDLGTAFNVLREQGMTEVGVSEGVVMVNPDGEAIRLVPGRVMRASDADDTIVVSSARPATIGSWQQGRLIYDNVPLAAVARDLSRHLGIRVVAAPDIAGRPVTAVVQLPKQREQLAPRLERLLDITVKQTEEGWVLTTKV
ncbi:MAG: FecR domain-containing protein [Pseudomonadota bacterium]|nr:FecR domain-containing protein [Pseudomonadota bacterium]